MVTHPGPRQIIETSFLDLVPGRDGELVVFSEIGGPVALYHLASETWRELGDLPENTVFAADPDGWMYALLSGSWAFAYSPEFEWTSMPQPPEGFTATHLLVGEGGRVYAFGGSDRRMAIFTSDR